LRGEAKELPPGIERDQLIRRARQADTGSHMNRWLTSPGLQPPKWLPTSLGQPTTKGWCSNFGHPVWHGVRWLRSLAEPKLRPLAELDYW